MITVTKAPFVLTPIHIVVGIKSKPQIPRGIEILSFQKDIPIKVNRTFYNQLLDRRGGDSDPPRPLKPLRTLGPFGLPMVNLGRPPLPPNKPYC
jgi:hypothetical protein